MKAAATFATRPLPGSTHWLDLMRNRQPSTDPNPFWNELVEPSPGTGDLSPGFHNRHRKWARPAPATLVH